MNDFQEEFKQSEIVSGQKIWIKKNQNGAVEELSSGFQRINIQQQIQQREPDIRNKQDGMIRNFKNDITRFLKHGRGWFPFRLPKSIMTTIQKQCPQTGIMKLSQNCLRIMSYNVLATAYTNEFEYDLVDKEYILWHNRFPDIKKEIQFLQPDVLCLQEFEQAMGLLQFIQEGLKYEGVFLKKQDALKSDGCATFYNPEKFALIQKFEIPFNFNPDSDLYFKSNCCLILALQPYAFPQKVFLVANTHIIFNVNRGDQKLAQLKMMTDAVAELKTYYQKVLKKDVSVFICGDFNSASKSGVYDFMRQGVYDCLKLPRNEISGQFRGMFSYQDKLVSHTLQGACYNLDVSPTRKDEGRICEWYTEITNTFPFLEYDESMQPIKFTPKTTVPFEKINMKLKRPRSVYCEEYLKTVDKYIASQQMEGK